MTPLAVLPTTSRDKEEVGRQLIKVTELCGVPVAVVSDGARELHEGAQAMKKLEFSGVHLDDMKHKVANLLKMKLGPDARFKAFSVYPPDKFSIFRSESAGGAPAVKTMPSDYALGKRVSTN